MNQHTSPPGGAVAVDPPGCGCTGCLTGESVPLHEATGTQIAGLLAGTLDNHTGLTFTLDPAIRAEPRATREET